MKQAIITTIAFLLTLTLSAQGRITTFLGIPVKGTESTMTKKLIKNGLTETRNGLLMTGRDGRTYLVQVVSNKGKVCRVSVIETEGTEDVNLAIAKYNALIEDYKNDTIGHAEYETNPIVRPANENAHRKFIQEGWYYAEFFQAAKPQRYKKRVAFRITDKYGDYRIEKYYDNLFNMPEDK